MVIMASEGSMLTDPGFWVALSTATFFLLVWRYGGFKALTGALDSKIEQITKDLDEAARLRDEAEKLLATYQKQQRETEKLAADMIAAAEQEAKDLLAKAEADAEAMIERRRKLAAERIVQAEAAAVKEVRAVAANAAVEAATSVLAKSLDGKSGSGLVDQAIDDIENRLHS